MDSPCGEACAGPIGPSQSGSCGFHPSPEGDLGNPIPSGWGTLSLLSSLPGEGAQVGSKHPRSIMFLVPPSEDGGSRDMIPPADHLDVGSNPRVGSSFLVVRDGSSVFDGSSEEERSRMEGIHRRRDRFAYPSSVPEHGGSLIPLWIPEGILSTHPFPLQPRRVVLDPKMQMRIRARSNENSVKESWQNQGP